MINWKLEKRKIKDLKEHPKNPRILSAEQAIHLQQSFDKFGIVDKIIINQDNTIIGGHQRKKILKKMGIKEVDCFVPDRPLSHDEVDELNIRLNKNTGDWDWDILANQWDVDKLIEWGFSAEELFDAPIKTIEPEEESEILEPAKDEDAITKLGDVYELNQHRIVCGDSTLPEYVDKCLNGNIPILMVTDPPYGVEYNAEWRNGYDLNLGKGFDGKQNRAIGKVKNDNQIDWSLSYFLFPGSVAYVWHAGKFASQVSKHLENCDFGISYQIIWAKQHFVFGRGDYHWQHEPCWYAIKNGHKHNWQGDRKQTTLWEINNNNPFGTGNDKEEKTGHSTQKPIECMARPIRNNSAEGESVYDPFLGSGTTLIAAEMNNRICYGIELSPAYCDIIVERWKKFMEKNNRQHSIKRNGIIV